MIGGRRICLLEKTFRHLGGALGFMALSSWTTMLPILCNQRWLGNPEGLDKSSNLDLNSEQTPTFIS